MGSNTARVKRPYESTAVDLSRFDSSIVAIPILGDSITLDPRDRGGPTPSAILGEVERFEGESE